MDPPMIWKGSPSSVNWEELALRPTFLLILRPPAGKLEEHLFNLMVVYLCHAHVM